MEKQTVKFLSFDKALENDMTFSQVIRHYKPEATNKEVDEWFKDAFLDCMLKGVLDTSHNLVCAIYYVSGKYINS